MILLLSIKNIKIMAGEMFKGEKLNYFAFSLLLISSLSFGKFAVAQEADSVINIQEGCPATVELTPKHRILSEEEIRFELYRASFDNPIPVVLNDVYGLPYRITPEGCEPNNPRPAYFFDGEEYIERVSSDRAYTATVFVYDIEKSKFIAMTAAHSMIANQIPYTANHTGDEFYTPTSITTLPKDGLATLLTQAGVGGVNPSEDFNNELIAFQVPGTDIAFILTREAIPELIQKLEEMMPGLPSISDLQTLDNVARIQINYIRNLEMDLLVQPTEPEEEYYVRAFSALDPVNTSGLTTCLYYYYNTMTQDCLQPGFQPPSGSGGGLALELLIPPSVRNYSTPGASGSFLTGNFGPFTVFGVHSGSSLFSHRFLCQEEYFEVCQKKLERMLAFDIITLEEYNGLLDIMNKYRGQGNLSQELLHEINDYIRNNFLKDVSPKIGVGSMMTQESADATVAMLRSYLGL